MFMLKTSSNGRNPNRIVGRKTAALRSAASAGTNGRALTESILTDSTAAAGELLGLVTDRLVAGHHFPRPNRRRAAAGGTLPGLSPSPRAAAGGPRRPLPPRE